MSAPRPPLRVALLIESLTQPRWVASIVRDILASEVAKLVLVVKVHDDSMTGRRPEGQQGARGPGRFLYQLYSKLDFFLTGDDPDPLSLVDITPLIVGCPVLGAVGRDREEGIDFPEADISTLGEYDLDLALAFGGLVVPRRALAFLRYGIWSYEHHAEPGAREVLEKAPVTECVLLAVTEKSPAPRALYRSYTRTDRRSVVRNRRHYLARASPMIQRKLRDLYYDDGDGSQNARQEFESSLVARERDEAAPAEASLTREVLSLGWRALKARVANAVCREQWFIAYRLGQPKTLLDAFQVARSRVLLPPDDRFWADPFPVQTEERRFIFFEEWLFRRPKGRIAVVEVDEGGQVSDPVTVLEREYHLSHPFIFEWEGTYYMIPETARNGTLEVYRARSFPQEWELAHVLMSGVRAVDATLAEISGRWWMFVSMERYGMSPSDNLHLFFAETPLGPWRPHRRNPIALDVRNARPAGGIVLSDGEYYRPAQDCAASYGHAIVVNRIEVLNEREYREVPVARIEPNWLPNLLATHTVNMTGDFTVVDGLRRRPRVPFRMV